MVGFSYGFARAARSRQRLLIFRLSPHFPALMDGAVLIVEAARKAKFVVAGIKSPGQRAGAEKVLRALERRLLPQGPDAAKEAYTRG